MYNDEKQNILKTTTLTQAAVQPSKLQLQNVQHVLKVFNEKVVAALRLKNFNETADMVEFVLNWWNTMNVSCKGLDKRFKDPNRAVQVQGSTSLDDYMQIFLKCDSGQGPSRVGCLTVDTRKALIQTMAGLNRVCDYLLGENAKFEYVLLREIQSDRLEGEFGVYRQSMGSNNFMSSGDVFSAHRKRLTQHAASYLQHIEHNVQEKGQHVCAELDVKDGHFIESCVELSLTIQEQMSCAYVAGWLEMKCQGVLTFSNDDELVTGEISLFIKEVSRGSLVVPHVKVFELVQLGLKFMNKARHRACCRQRLCKVFTILSTYCDIDIANTKLYMHLANVLLHGLHKPDRDLDKDTVLYQTSVKKMRMK